MKYVLLLMGNHDGPRCGEDEAPGVEDFVAYDRELQEAGVLAGGFALTDPEDATTVMLDGRGSEPIITAGPYAESREFVGGTFILDVADLDEALRWAAKCPGALDGRVEVRALLDL
ncbi:MAG: hypothetical protein GX596_02930 [Propionibacterium sp.]|nr:hypothetical protein [Propionibacterium sp.]